MTAIEKIVRLARHYGRNALDHHCTGPNRWWVTWDDGRGPVSFNSYQAFHSYLDELLGKERNHWRRSNVAGYRHN